MTLHPDLRAMLPHPGQSVLSEADLTAFAVAVLRKAEKCCVDSCDCGDRKTCDRGDPVAALARRWQEGAS